MVIRHQSAKVLAEVRARGVKRGLKIMTRDDMYLGVMIGDGANLQVSYVRNRDFELLSRFLVINENADPVRRDATKKLYSWNF